jgi:hypothetical protein
MQLLRRLCLGALLFELAACSRELDQTNVEPPTRDERPSADRFDDNRLTNNQPTNASPLGAHCTAQPGGGRFALCGGMSNMPGTTLNGIAIAGSALSFAPVESGSHLLAGEISAN